LSHTKEPNLSDKIDVLIEISKGSNIKYEMDFETGKLSVDRKLSTSMYYPYNYGFVPNTEDSTGDPLDVFVLGDDPFEPMSTIKSRPIAVLLTEDQDGSDPKIIAAPIDKVDPSFSSVSDLKGIQNYVCAKLEHFVLHHKDLEKGKYVKIMGWRDKEFAKEIISEAIERWSKHNHLS
jgi:inorganic pyrophosphatase